MKTLTYERKLRCISCVNPYLCSSTRNGCALLTQRQESSAGLAGLKASRRGFSFQFLNRYPAMKNYMTAFVTAGKQHLVFLQDNFQLSLLSMLAGFGAWLLQFVEVYIFADYRFLISLALMIAYDAFSGLQKQRYLHRLDPMKHERPTSKVFKDKTFSKIGYYAVVLGSLHGLAHFTVKGDEVTYFHAFEYTALVSMMAAEFWSIQENYAAMGKTTIFSLAWEQLQKYLPKKELQK